MAISAASAGTPLADPDNLSSYATASWQPAGSKLYLLAILNTDAANAITPSVTGNSMTWDLVASAQRADAQRRVSIFRGYSTSPSPGALTIDYAGDAQQGCAVHISEWTGTAGSGDNGASAIVQSVTSNWTSTANPSITLAAFGSANNGTYGALNHGNAMTSGAGFTQLDNNALTTPNAEFMSQWRADNDTSVDCTAGSAQGCGVAVEIAAASASVYIASRPIVVLQAVQRSVGW